MIKKYLVWLTFDDYSITGVRERLGEIRTKYPEAVIFEKEIGGVHRVIEPDFETCDAKTELDARETISTLIKGIEEVLE